MLSTRLVLQEANPMATVSDNDPKSTTPSVAAKSGDRRPAHTEPNPEAVAADGRGHLPGHRPRRTDGGG
jgi:hypothetical protein